MVWKARDPERTRDLRRRAAATVMTQSAGAVSWASTADLMFLVQSPVIRNSYLTPGGLQHPVEGADRDDHGAIMAIAERFDGATGARVHQAWWRHRPGGFVV